MKKVLLAAMVAAVMSMPAFAAPQPYSVEVGTWKTSAPNAQQQQQQPETRQMWRSEQPQGHQMQMGSGQCQGGGECPMMQAQPESKMKAKATKASGKSMKKPTTAKKRAPKAAQPQPQSEGDVNNAMEPAPSGMNETSPAPSTPSVE